MRLHIPKGKLARGVLSSRAIPLILLDNRLAEFYCRIPQALKYAYKIRQVGFLSVILSRTVSTRGYPDTKAVPRVDSII